MLSCALLALAQAGCGYHSALGAGSTRLDDPGEAQTVSRPRVSVVALRSDSSEPWLDRIVTDALRREVGGRARLRLIDDPKGAEFRVQGRIRPLAIQSRSFSSLVAALEYSLTVELDLEVRLESGDVVRLDTRMLSETDSYLASPDIEVTRTNRLEALRRISDLLAVRVADAIELIERPMSLPGAAPTATKGDG